MSFRSYLDHLQNSHRLVHVSAPISKDYEISGVLYNLEPQPVLFKNVADSRFRVAGNLFCGKEFLADYFGVPASGLIALLSAAIDRHFPGRVVGMAPCQEVVVADPDLEYLPVLRHFPGDGGPYISSGVVIARHPRYGQNLDFHRCMQFSPTEMAMRVVRSRHFDTYLQELGQVDVAICLGNAPNVLLSAATSLELGVDELEIANALEPLDLVQAKTVDLYVPAESEFVLEGTVYRDNRHAEGPFVDLTETQDVVREEPVFVVKAITHRHNAIWQALLPGRLEHKLLMGMPREPTIFRKVNEVVRCLDVNLNPGGCSWLHAIVQIDKEAEEDGRKAILATFAGHRSCKHVFVVDQDVDIYDPMAVEWALATRFQADRDLVILPRQPGSSLDPSAEPGTYLTSKLGFDLTRPLETQGKTFSRAPFPQVDLARFLPEFQEQGK
jgi:UbiD family decarboxylase